METLRAGLTAPTIVLLDEIEAALESSELDDVIWTSLRALAADLAVGGRLAFMLACQRRPAELAVERGLGSPFFNIFAPTLVLGPLGESEARTLIASSPVPFVEPDVKWILEHSGRWPALLQMLCRERLESLEAGDTGAAWQAEALRQIAPFTYLLQPSAAA